ncbi:MAG: glycogen/starch/alpha-glucan phosphorylase [Gammaproteobacteria bacterium]|nr:glycogen/starch/alpha-glucan phosphorylase [Gammaproteobacteria bacterium]
MIETEKFETYATARSIVDNTDHWTTPRSTEISVDSFVTSVRRQFESTLGLELSTADSEQLYTAIALAVREQIFPQWRATREQMRTSTHRRTCYLSLEFLLGRSLSNAVHNLDLTDTVKDALLKLGLDLETVATLEPDAGLGNGGLGRLAACFLDSCATLKLPVTGYGLRYRYGMFHQKIEQGYQHEHPDNWLLHGHPWEISRPELRRQVQFGGHVSVTMDTEGREHRVWQDTDDIVAIPYDVPIPGYKNGHINTLRLWSATATDAFNLAEFNAGGYTESVSQKTNAQALTMVLYPNDQSENGKTLRLKQQYFLVSASLQDTLHQWRQTHSSFEHFANAHCFQMNDTHPSLAVPELMRLLIDDYYLNWNEAWEITTSTLAYTNHTLLPEALECWSLGLMEHLLPRPTEIIKEINHRFLDEVAKKWPGDSEKANALSIISNDEYPMVRMAHLAIVGSFSVNGVAQLHSELLQKGLFKTFNALWPERFNNKTNGVTPRRWLSHCNPGLANLLNETIGNEWQHDLNALSELETHAHLPELQRQWHSIKQQNKQRLIELVSQRTGVDLHETMLFDVQVKRIHEYKRQLLCALHAVHLYLTLKRQGSQQFTPRAILVAGKAAPGYDMAKWIIKLINNIAHVINSDPACKDLLRLVFLPDYNVSAMEIICPAADLSEQISTAGKEASGTGNMKFMMNGALTIGTLDGANVEILDAVGSEHFFLFGLTVDQVQKTLGQYDPGLYIKKDPRIKAIIDSFAQGRFDGDDAELVKRVIGAATSHTDPWMTIADLGGYLDAQQSVEQHWQTTAAWRRSSILNTATSGRFSSDRTIQDYNDDIWHLKPLATN